MPVPVREARHTRRCAACPCLLPSLPCPQPPGRCAARCRLDNYTGSVALDPAEVSEWKYVALPELQAHAEQYPEQYTQWFLDEAASLGWFKA